jgi:hypothetical protein
VDALNHLPDVGARARRHRCGLEVTFCAGTGVGGAVECLIVRAPGRSLRMSPPARLARVTGSDSSCSSRSSLSCGDNEARVTLQHRATGVSCLHDFAIPRSGQKCRPNAIRLPGATSSRHRDSGFRLEPRQNGEDSPQATHTVRDGGRESGSGACADAVDGADGVTKPRERYIRAGARATDQPSLDCR